MISIIRFLLRFNFNWEDITNTQPLTPFQTPQSSSKILRYTSNFQLSSQCMELRWKTLFRPCLIYLLNQLKTKETSVWEDSNEIFIMKNHYQGKLHSSIHSPKGVNINVAPTKKPRNRALKRRQSLVHSVNHHKANTIKPNNMPIPELVSITPVNSKKSGKRNRFSLTWRIGENYVKITVFRVPMFRTSFSKQKWKYWGGTRTWMSEKHNLHLWACHILNNSAQTESACTFNEFFDYQHFVIRHSDLF